VEGVRPRDRPKKTWNLVIENDCQSRQICKEDAVDSRKWRKLIKDVVQTYQVSRISRETPAFWTPSPAHLPHR